MSCHRCCMDLGELSVLCVFISKSGAWTFSKALCSFPYHSAPYISSASPNTPDPSGFPPPGLQQGNSRRPCQHGLTLCPDGLPLWLNPPGSANRSYGPTSSAGQPRIRPAKSPLHAATMFLSHLQPAPLMPFTDILPGLHSGLEDERSSWKCLEGTMCSDGIGG